MKKLYTTLVAVLAISHFSYAQYWSNGSISTGTIYYNGGNVGIGTNNPLSKLDISGNLILRNYQNAGGAGASIVFTNYGDDYQHSPSIRSYLDYANGASSQARLVLSSYGNGQSNNELTLLNGNVGIGIMYPDAKLAVNGTIHTKEVKVDLNGWSDYVFNDDYKLKSIPEVESYIKKNHHLPDVPSATEVEKNGVNLGETSSLLLKKIEELTLYLIDKDKQVNEQKTQLKNQQKQIDELKAQMAKLLK